MLARVTSWMKRALVVGMIALGTMGYGACDQNAVDGFDSERKIPTFSGASSDDSLGIIHNQVLELAFAKLDSARSSASTASADGNQSFEAVFGAGNLTLKKTRVDTLAEEQARYYFDLGASMKREMLMLPEGTESINEVLFGSRPADDVVGKATASTVASMPTYFTQYVNILKNFVNEGRSNSAFEAYDSTVMLLGAPEPGSKLARFMSILKYSSRFWLEKYQITPGTLCGSSGASRQALSWSLFWGIVAGAAVDAAGGIVTGLAVGAATGPGAIATGIVGGVVSVLASWGAGNSIAG